MYIKHPECRAEEWVVFFFWGVVFGSGKTRPTNMLTETILNSQARFGERGRERDSALSARVKGSHDRSRVPGG